MSTRGMIAYVRGEGVLFGTYQHFDSYPDVLGRSLLARYRDLGCDVVRMRNEAVDEHLAGWSSYPETPYTDDDMSRECRCPMGDYTHCDALFMEWLYVINTSGLDVYKSAPTGQTETNTRYDGYKWESALYRHILVGTLPWDADDKAIDAMEERGHEVHEAEWQAHNMDSTVR